jgi:hypothetical protein
MSTKLKERSMSSKYYGVVDINILIVSDHVASVYAQRLSNNLVWEQF